MKKHTWRTILIVVTFLVTFYFIYPTFGWMLLSEEGREARLAKWAEEDKVYQAPDYWRDLWKSVKRWSEFDRDRVINLGLDLQGGIHMIVGIDKKSVNPETIQEMKDAGYTEDLIWKEYQDQVLQTIRRRIAEFEAQEPIIQAKGKDQVEIQLPGEKNVERAKNIIMRTAYLTFHMVAGRDETDKVFTAIEKKYPQQFVPFLRKPADLRDTYAPYEVPAENIKQVMNTVKEATDAGGIIPEDKTIAFSGAPKPWSESKMYRVYLLDKKAGMSGEQLVEAAARQDPQRGANQWMILFQFTPAGGRQFGELTAANVNRSMAIVVDDVVESAPVIQTKITTNGQITGDFGRDEARDLAIALKSGAMPVRITEDFTGVVGASLGEDSIRKGVWSSIVSLLIVLAFMWYYYRFAGFVANVALFVNALLVVAAMAYFKATLTLPGIAGLILSIGMAVDSNVLIYERIREEILNGKSLAAAINAGFDRAAVTILDANITTIIAAAVLLEFGTGPIVGFAITLCIGVGTSVFCALIISRAIFDFCIGKPWFKTLKMMSFFKLKSTYNFLSYRGIACAVSAVVILVGMVAFGWRGENNFGVEFTTGTTMIVNLDSKDQIQEDQIRTTLSKAGFDEPSVQTYEQDNVASRNRFFIRLTEELKEKGVAQPAAESAQTPPADQKAEQTTPAPAQEPSAASTTPSAEPAAAATPAPSAETAAAAPSSADQTTSSDVVRALSSLCDNVVLERVDTVGPAVGNELKWNAVLSVLCSFVFIIAYLWFRFELKFAVGTIVALVHDVLVTLGVVALTGRYISMNVVAVVLTIIGYSLNDTIVIFDRVREDLKLYRGRGYTLMHLLDLAINQTLSRTILTSLTVMFVVVVLFFMGGESINDFAFAMIVGLIAGSYSTVYIASPIVYYWEKYLGKQSLLVTAGESRRATTSRRVETVSPLDVESEVGDVEPEEEENGGPRKPEGAGRSKTYRRGGRR